MIRGCQRAGRRIATRCRDELRRQALAANRGGKIRMPAPADDSFSLLVEMRDRARRRRSPPRARAPEQRMRARGATRRPRRRHIMQEAGAARVIGRYGYDDALVRCRRCALVAATGHLLYRDFAALPSFRLLLAVMDAAISLKEAAKALELHRTLRLILFLYFGSSSAAVVRDCRRQLVVDRSLGMQHHYCFAAL